MKTTFTLTVFIIFTASIANSIEFLNLSSLFSSTKNVKKVSAEDKSYKSSDATDSNVMLEKKSSDSVEIISPNSQSNQLDTNDVAIQSEKSDSFYLKTEGVNSELNASDGAKIILGTEESISEENSSISQTDAVGESSYLKFYL